MKHPTIKRELTREELEATVGNLTLELEAVCKARDGLEKQLEAAKTHIARMLRPKPRLG